MSHRRFFGLKLPKLIWIMDLALLGVLAYVVAGIERDIPLQTVFKGSLPFLGALILAALILLAFPQICLFLPQLAR